MDGYGGCHFPIDSLPHGGLMEAKSLQGDQISAYHLTAAATRGDWTPNDGRFDQQMMGDTRAFGGFLKLVGPNNLGYHNFRKHPFGYV